MAPKSKSKKEKMNYVLDTSVLVYHGESIHSFEDANIYIPIEVLEEIDRLKTKMDLVGANARYINKYLDQLRQEGSLLDGVSTEFNQKIFIADFSDIDLLPSTMEDCADNRIISCAAVLLDEGKPVTLVSRDISLRVRCDILRIPAESYEKVKAGKHDYFNDGVITINVSKEELDSFYQDEYLDLRESQSLFVNQGVLLKAEDGSSAIAMAVNDHSVRKLKFAAEKGFSMEGVAPRSAEQSIASELLIDPNIHLVTISGIAGSGKTMLALAAALKLIGHGKAYKRLIITRQAESTAKDIGYLPGTKEEKMAPWMAGVFDNLENILGNKKNGYVQMLIDKGVIELESLSYIRGRSLHDTIFLIDEAQNISYDEAKAIITRAGNNCKIIMTGDLEQIDSKSLDAKNSGLGLVAETFKEFEHAGHIRLRKGERSKLAAYAAKVM